MQCLGRVLRRVDGRTRGKELHRARAAILLEGDPIDLAVGGRCHIEETLVAVECQTVGAEGWRPARLRHEPWILNPNLVTRAIRSDLEDGAEEGIGNVEVAMPVLSDRIGSLKTGGHDLHRVRLHIDAKQPTIRGRPVREVGHVQALARLKQLAQE